MSERNHPTAGEAAKLLAEATIAWKMEMELKVEIVLLDSEIHANQAQKKGFGALRRKVASAVHQ